MAYNYMHLLLRSGKAVPVGLHLSPNCIHHVGEER